MGEANIKQYFDKLGHNIVTFYSEHDGNLLDFLDNLKRLNCDIIQILRTDEITTDILVYQNKDWVSFKKEVVKLVLEEHNNLSADHLKDKDN